MKKLLTVSLAVLLVAAIVGPALAIEFEMTGDYEYRYRYFSRMGDRDLFGNMTIQELGWTANADGTTNGGAQPYTYSPVLNPGNSTVGGAAALFFTVPGNQYIGLAGPNMWGSGQVTPNNQAGTSPLVATNYGTIITRGGLSKTFSDASYPDHRLTVHPVLRINPAIRVHGTYNVGGIRNRFNMTNSGMGIAPFERYAPINAVSFSSQDTVGIGSWEQVRATVTLPWGILSYGMKDFPFGYGTFTTLRLRGSAFVAVIPYGPFRFIPAFWQGYSTNFGVQSQNFRPDASNKATYFGGFLATYETGEISTGGGWIGRSHHDNADQSQTFALGNYGDDQWLNIWAYYFKFNNGRFFANAEYQWATNDIYAIRPTGTLTPGVSSTQRPATYREYYHLIAELGMMAGPSKVSLMWAQASGPVRNNYSADDVGMAGGLSGRNPKRYTAWGIDWQCLDPYQYLMFGVYAGGNQTFTGLFLSDDGKGLMSDAWCYAGRLDYAVAANLNLWATYMWAHRLEKYGTLVGQYYSDGRDTTAPGWGTSVTRQGYTPPPIPSVAPTGAEARLAFRTYHGYPTNYPEYYVEDGFLGWEVNVGADWKLLEHFTLKTRYAYWQPGEWYNLAYQAIALVPNTINTVTANGYLGTRDPIQAFEGSFVIDF